MTQLLMNHYRSLGGWSFAFGSYYKHNITSYFTGQRFKDIMTYVNPFSK